MLPENHGLALLKARLALTFGDRARLTIDSRAGRTSVVIELPGMRPSTQRTLQRVSAKLKRQKPR